MAEKPYTVKDRRRIDARGKRREAVKIPGKRELHFKEVQDSFDSAFAYFRAQVERLPGRNWPRSGQLRDLLRGFIISTQQLYAATILLIADNRPKALVMPAALVARALVEGLGNLFAILEDPQRASLDFLKDDFRHAVGRIRYYRERWPEWTGYANVGSGNSGAEIPEILALSLTP